MKLGTILPLLLQLSFYVFAFGDTATDLATAIESGDLAAVTAIIQNGASLELPISDGQITRTPLTKAVASGTPEIVSYLITAGANVNLKDSTGDTPLLSAIRSGRTDIVQLLISNGSRIDAKDAQAFSGVAIAAASGYNEILKSLVHAGSDVQVEISGLTPLMLAVAAGKIDTVNLLIDLGAPVNQISSSSGQTALFTAVKTGNTTVLQALINRGADVNFKTQKGETSLKLAQQGNQSQVVTLLQAAGATQ